MGVFQVLKCTNGTKSRIASQIFAKLVVAEAYVTWLNNFTPVSHFYTPWKRQKNYGFLTFSGGIEMWHWTKMGK